MTAAYRASFFPAAGSARSRRARAGNVIGGGDWAADRLVPDIMRALRGRASRLLIRNPDAIRPWQHVLEPLPVICGLAEALHQRRATCTTAWNFGPADDDMKPVVEVVGRS